MDTLRFADEGSLSIGIGGPCPEQMLDVSGGYVGIAGEFCTQPNHKLEVSIGNLNPNQKLEVVNSDENKEDREETLTVTGNNAGIGTQCTGHGLVFNVSNMASFTLFEYEIDYEKIKTIEDVVEVFKLMRLHFSFNNEFKNSPYLKLKEDKEGG